MIYNTQHQIPIKDLEEYSPVDIIDHAKKQMVVNMALKMYEEGLFNFDIFDPREPIKYTTDMSELKMLEERKKHLLQQGAVEITLKLNI